VSTNPLPPWMIAENFGEHTGTPSGSGPQPMPPGFPAGLWIDLTPAPTAAPPTNASAPPVAPPTNPQVGVETLPPPNSTDPAPLPGAGSLPGSRDDDYAPPGGVISPLPPDADYSLGPAVGIPGYDPDDYERAIDEDAMEYRFRPFPEVYFGGGNFNFWVQPDTQTRPRVEIPQPSDAPYNPPAPPGSEPDGARRRQGARERDAIIRDAVSRSRADSAIRSGRGRVIQGAARRVVRRILGPFGDALFPEELGSGEVSEAERVGRELDERLRSLEDMAREIFDNPYRGRGVLGPEIAPLPEPAPPVISPPWPTPSPTASRSPPLPQPSTPQQPRPAQPTTTRSPAPQRPASTSPSAIASSWPWLSPLLSSVISGAVSTPSGARSRFTLPQRLTGPAPAVDPLTPPRPTIGTDPLTPPRGNPLTRFDAAPLGSSPPGLTQTRTRTRECRCEKPKRKKQRKCRARAPLKWAGGPRKGQSAGSRCYSFGS